MNQKQDILLETLWVQLKKVYELVYTNSVLTDSDFEDILNIYKEVCKKQKL